jgi:hypothetical protein
VILAIAFWLWCAGITFGAGFLGSILNCEYGCSGDGTPSWFEPWTWGDHYVYPEALYIGLVGLAAATAFVVLLARKRLLLATAALILTLVLLSYPFFAGLTASGRVLFSFGPLLAITALLVGVAHQRRWSY